MTTEQIAAIVGAAVGAGGLGALLAYFTARRRASGQIGTTDADRLWGAIERFTGVQADELNDLRARLTLSDNRFFAVEQENRACQGRTDLLEKELRAVQELLKAKVETAEAKVAVAEGKTAIAELKQKNGGGTRPPQTEEES